MFFPANLSKIIIFANILLLLSISTVASDAAEEIEDYSKGFEVFYKLGLPDVSNAEYVQLDFAGFDPCRLFDPSLRLRKGNAWRLKNEGNGSPASFIVFNALSLKVYDGRKLFEEFKRKNKKPDMKYDEFLAGNKPIFMGSWKRADIKDDIEDAFSMLEGDTDSHWHLSPGAVFLYAIQFHRKGFKKEANKMISVLFAQSKDRKVLLMNAMSCLADQQYEQALLDLSESGDWEKFGNDLDALLKKYPRCWESAPGIKLLHGMVQNRIKNPVRPEIKGEGISEEDKKLAAEFVNIKEVPYSYGLRVVLPQNKKKENYDPEDDVIEKVKNRGKAAIPMLTALLQDDYMITAYGEVQEKGNTDSEEALSHIPHPVRRKDIARNLLLPAIAFSEENERVNVNSLSDNNLVEVCRIWYDEIKSKTDDEVIAYYLKNGDENQKDYVIDVMMKTDIAKYSEAIEDFFLEIKKKNLSNRNFNFLEKYVMERGKAAAPFVEKLKAKFKDELALAERYYKQQKEDETKDKKAKDERKENPEEEEEDDDPGEKIAFSFLTCLDLKRQFDVLDMLSEGKSAKQLVDELGSGKNKGRAWYLSSMLGRMDREEVLDIILYGVKQHRNDIDLRRSFMILLWMFFCKEQPYGMLWMFFCKEQAYEVQKKPFTIEKNAEVWKELLEDKRCLQETETMETDISSAAISLIEYIYGNEKDIKNANRLGNIVGQKSASILRKRAMERLAGRKEEELTPYPEIKKLNEKETEKLIADIKKAKKNAGGFLDNIGFSEFAALPELLDKNPELNADLKSYANRIVKVKSLIKGEEKAFDVFKDSELDMKTVEKIREYCKKLTSEKKRFKCDIEKRSFFEGISIVLKKEGDNETPEPKMFGIIDIGKDYILTKWNVGGKDTKESVNEIVVDGKKIKLETDEADKTITDSPEKFVKCLEKALGDGQNCSSSFKISFMDIEPDPDWNVE